MLHNKLLSKTESQSAVHVLDQLCALIYIYMELVQVYWTCEFSLKNVVVESKWLLIFKDIDCWQFVLLIGTSLQRNQQVSLDFYKYLLVYS